MKIESRFGGLLLYEGDHATIKLCAEAAAAAKLSLSGAGLSRADLTGANLAGADLSRANLTCAGLTGADLTGANLAGADLSRANLTCAGLTGADLSRADLTRADLFGAKLSEAKLSGATLSGANLTCAGLTGANLSGAGLSRADLSRAVGLIDGGQDVRGYRFVAQIRNGMTRILAGCRDFTVAEARAHWGPESKSSNAAECLGKVEMLAAEARRRGWPIESSKMATELEQAESRAEAAQRRLAACYAVVKAARAVYHATDHGTVSEWAELTDALAALDKEGT